MPQQIGNEIHYSVEEVSVCANEDYRTSLKKVNEGMIDSISVGRQKLVPHSSLVDYMDSLNLPEEVIGFRLEITSPKTGKKLAGQKHRIS